MNVTTKKLLSMLIVLAMVLSMTPVIALPAAATDTNPGAAGNLIAQNAAAQNFDDYVAGELRMCYACGQEVAWTAINSDYVGTTKALGPGHYYLAESIEKTATGSLIKCGTSATSNDGICLHLNNKDLTVNGGQYAIDISRKMNVMGNGNVRGSATRASVRIRVSYNGVFGPANLYGGTYWRSTNNNSETLMKSAILVNTSGTNGGATVYANIYGDPTGAGAYGVIIDGSVDEGKTADVAAYHYWDVSYTATTMYGGLIRNGSAAKTETGASVHVGGATNSFTMYGGKISGGTNTVGSCGSISLNGTTFTLEGGIIENGSTPGQGGNFMLLQSAKLVVNGGTIRNGRGKTAANIQVNAGCTLEVYDGLIYGGVASETGTNKYGANIWTGSNSVLKMGGGTIVGDIYIPSSAIVTLSGSPKIVKSLELEGGATANAMYAGLYFFNAGGPAVNISELDADAEIVVSNVALNRVFTAADDNAVNVVGCFTTDGLTAAEGYEIVAVATNAKQIGFVEQEIVVPEETTEATTEASTVPEETEPEETEPEVQEPVQGVFNPAACGGRAYCDVCGTPQTWTEVTSSTTSLSAGNHYYLSAHYEYAPDTRGAGLAISASSGEICFNLNGKNMTATADSTQYQRGLIEITGACTLNLFNSEDTTSVLTGTGYVGSDAWGSALAVNKAGAVCNLSGKITFTKMASTNSNVASSIVCIAGNGGTINMGSEITVDARNLVNTKNAPAVYIIGNYANDYLATFNLNGGTIYGGKLYVPANDKGVDATGATMTVGAGASNYALFNMISGHVYPGENPGYLGCSGIVIGGTNSNADNHNKAVITGGTVHAAAQAGSSIQVRYDATLELGGTATIYGYEGYQGGAVMTQRGTTVKLYGSANVLSNGENHANMLTLSTNSTVVEDGTKYAKLLVDKDYAGQAYIYVIKSNAGGYLKGEAIRSVSAGVENGTTFAGGHLYLGTTKDDLVGYEGQIYLANAALVSGGVAALKANAAHALADYQNGDVVRLLNSQDVVLTKDAYVDLNGTSPNISGAYNLYLINTANEDFATNGAAVIDEATTIVRIVNYGGKDYVNIDDIVLVGDDEKVPTLKTFSCYVEMDLTAVTLRPSTSDTQMGLYYKAQISMGEKLDSFVKSYGIAVSLKNMPGADFAMGTEVTENAWTAITGLSVGEDNYTVTTTSGAVFGIMKSTKEANDNQAHGEKDIYANAYLWFDFNGDSRFDAGEFLMSDTANAGKTVEDQGFNGVAWSLKDIMVEIDTNWAKYESAQGRVTTFYQYWYDKGMVWALNNIKPATV